MKGSGLTEIVIESAVCASGFLDKVMSGKHYNRALRVHKLTVETLERLLLCKFKESGYSQDNPLLHLEARVMFESLAKSHNPGFLKANFGK